MSDLRFAVSEKIRRNIRRYDLGHLAMSYGISLKKNKGWVGKTLERFANLSNSNISEADGPDYELKSVKVLMHLGDWVPAETMSMTMFNPQRVLEEEFETSAVWKKLQRMIVVGCYYPPGKPLEPVIRFVRPVDICDPELVRRIQDDWRHVKIELVNGRIARYSSKGTSERFIQLRTKGTNGSQSTCPITGEKFNTRAFYATKPFLRYVWGICDV